MVLKSEDITAFERRIWSAIRLRDYLCQKNISARLSVYTINDVSNQQDATYSVYWSFKSALHVSGDKLSHLQEHCWLYIQLLVQCTDIAADQCHRSAAISVHCTKSCIYSQNFSCGWASLSPETCRADLKRSINGICRILLVVYFVVLMMHGLTNIKLHE